MNVLDRSRLRHPIEIWRYVQTARGGGAKPGFNNAWAKIADVWAEVIARSGREALIDRAVQGISTYQVTIDPTDITTKDQIKLADGTVLNIRSIEPDATGRVWLSILADTETVQDMG